MSELLQVLLLVEEIAQREPTYADLCATQGVSRATVMRRIREARHLGARIEGYRDLICSYRYRLYNAEQVWPMLQKWIEYERKREQIDLSGAPVEM